MAEKRKISTAAAGGAKRIKALFSSFIRKEKNSQDKDNSPAEPDEAQATIAGNQGQRADDTTDQAVSSAKQDTPSRRSFRPLNIEDFFGRVETFTISLHSDLNKDAAFGWFAKPLDLSPLHCARYGWENIDADCLKCVSCREILCGGLPALWETESYCQAYSKLKDSLKTAHSKICPWPDSPSPESFVHIPLGDIKLAVEGFYSRVDSMYPLGKDLPSIDCSPINEEGGFNIHDIKAVFLKAVAERDDSVIIASEEESPVWLAVYLLAVFGWRKSQSEQTGCPVLECQYCRRHAGLWNFTSLKEADSKASVVNNPSRIDSDKEPQAKRIKDIEKSTFNPAMEHRTWCPWVQPSPVQPVKMQRISNEPSDMDDKPLAELSWQQLLAILQKKTDPDTHGALPPVINKETTPPSQTWKAVRRILNVWQSKETVAPPEKEANPTKESS